MSARGKPSPRKIPFLPGCDISAHESVFRKNHHKKQTLSFAWSGKEYNNSAAADPAKSMLPKIDLSVLSTLGDPFRRFDLSSTRPVGEERQEAIASARKALPAKPPAWLKHDRQVLSFSAYFEEPVYDNPKETMRIRSCTIYYYLSDDTIMISEPKLNNSGIPQGLFVKRHRVPKSGSDFITHRDFVDRDSITIYGREYTIHDCDQFTRDFYKKSMGVEIRPNTDLPIDSFRAQTLAEEEWRRQPLSEDIAEAKLYRELLNGGSRKNQKLQRYLANDRQVLCFKAFWDDTTRYGIRNFYTVHYYLADESVEILETLSKNSGRNPWPALWRRGPLCKNPRVSVCPGMMVETESVLYQPDDFVVGTYISVYGRELFLYDCNDSTRQFYVENHGFEQEKIEIAKPKVVSTSRPIPPHTGFGSEDDSLASCLRLTPRPPKKDYLKAIHENDRALRFEARMYGAQPEHEDRKFILAFYLADDTMSIWEKQERNSGHMAGKFASKAKTKNKDTGELFKAQDLHIGASVEVNSVRFELLTADVGTLRLMEERCSEFPVADKDAIVEKLAEHRDSLAATKEDALAMEDLGRICAEAGVSLCRHELITLARAFGQEGDDERRTTDDAAEGGGLIVTSRLVEALTM